MADYSSSLSAPDSAELLTIDVPPVRPVESNFSTALLLNGFTAMYLYLIFGMPRLEKMYEDLGTAPPVLTRVILSLGKWMSGSLTPDQSFPGIVWLGFAMGIGFCVIVAHKSAALRRTKQPALSRGVFYFLTSLVVLPLTLLAHDIFIAQEITLLTELSVLYVLLLPTAIWMVLWGLYASGWIDSPNLTGGWARNWICVGLILVTGISAWASFSPVL